MQKNYFKSIHLNEYALSLIVKRKLDKKYLLTVYRRLGNDYNDIVRNNIPFSIPKKSCYELGLNNYKKEASLLFEDKNPNNTKIALNYITTAMLSRTVESKDKIIKLYSDALKALIVSNFKELFFGTALPVTNLSK